MSKKKLSSGGPQVIAGEAAGGEEDNPYLNINARPIQPGTGGDVAITESVSQPKTFKRGTNPASLANLKPPWKPGERPPSPGNPYPISRHLKDLLSDQRRGREVAETIMQTACLPSSRGYSTALTALLERTEGKVAGDETKAPAVNVLTVVVKDAETKTMLEALKSAQFAQLAEKNGE